MNGIYYFPVFMWGMSTLAILYSAQYLSSGNDSLYIKGAKNFVPTLLICIVLIYWMGMRPISGIFGDTLSYYRAYSNLEYQKISFDINSEWLWAYIMQLCYSIGLSVHGFFTVIEFGYIISIFAAVCIITPKNPLLGMLFVFTSFSFFTFGVNGLRNGLAIHIILLGFALYLLDRKAIAYILFLAAFGIHRSIILPTAAFLASIYIIKDPKFAIYIWIASVPISFVSGYYFVGLFSNLGFDDRMNQYLTVGETNALDTSTSAFRWDFLLYSSMPVLMAWYVCIKEKVTDTWFNVLASTYCLSNSFWVLVIRASFSNRFAYLSWFIYPIVIAYPLIMLPLWNDQDSKTGIILIGYTLLTLSICLLTHIL